ncbi:formate/nitrite transporter family protein [Novosphingobium terrae]|uniref:formate/nitrite transporter family protein n=1 Tax=Novosphingobium terrae TaxID=2726189 RepID=UPI001F141E11|nr:formate/nitrite transporter family protein [Novosphingobium terrae]
MTSPPSGKKTTNNPAAPELVADAAGQDIEARERDIALTEEERAVVVEKQAANTRIIHEVVRRHGDEEMERPALSLLFSGLAGGIGICASILAQAQLEMLLPDEAWRPLVASFGYTVGFLIVILGHLQLFTESTLSAVIPVATHPTRANVIRLLRFWFLVLGANLAGTLMIAITFDQEWIITGHQHQAMLDLSGHLLDRSFLQTLRMGIPAGFLIAAVPWMLPSSKGQEFWVIVTLTYLISLGGFAHVVAGSGEAWLLALAVRPRFSTHCWASCYRPLSAM